MENTWRGVLGWGSWGNNRSSGCGKGILRFVQYVQFVSVSGIQLVNSLTQPNHSSLGYLVHLLGPKFMPLVKKLFSAMFRS